MDLDKLINEIYIIFFKDHENEVGGPKVLKVCLNKDIANRKLIEYKDSDHRPLVEYYILPYEVTCK